jgi:hypothetical protein
MSDDYLDTIRCGGPPTHWLLLLPSSIVVALMGIGSGSLLFVLGETGAALLTIVSIVLPAPVLAWVSIRGLRRRKRLSTLLATGQRVWARVLEVERGMGRMKRRGGRFISMPHQGIFLSARVSVEWAPQRGAARVGECRGWFRAAELDALERAGQVPVIVLDGFPEVIVGPIQTNGEVTSP